MTEVGPDTAKTIEQQSVGAALSWWRGLFPGNDDGKGAARDGDAAARARLRRCNTVFDVLMEPSTHALLRAVRATGLSFRGLEHRLALLAATLARVPPTGRGGAAFATLLGTTEDGRFPDRKKGERPRLSELRFSALVRSLAAADDPDRALRSLRRVLPMLGGSPFDGGGFVRDLLLLSDDTQRRWVFAYWQTEWRRPDPKGETTPNPELPMPDAGDDR